MKLSVLFSAILVLVLLAGSLRPAAAGSNDRIAELQAQMTLLVQNQQKSSEEMGALRDKMNTLVQQTSDNLSHVSEAVAKLDKSLQQQQGASDSCVDQLAGQAQPLHDELTELRGKMDAMMKQLSEMNGAHPSPAAPATPGANASGPGTDNRR